MENRPVIINSVKGKGGKAGMESVVAAGGEATMTTNRTTVQRPEHRHYVTVEQFIHTSIQKKDNLFFDRVAFEEALYRLEEEYEFPYEALVSFIRNIHVNHIKRTAPQVKANLEHYATEYCSSSDGSTPSVLTLAKEANYPPYLFARLLVEQITNLAKSDLGAAVASPAQYLVDPTILKPQYRSSSEQNTQAMMARLAQQVHKAVTSDPLCGPRHDVARRMVGVEFEVVLEQQLSALGIPFETEANLRSRGSSRTPDVLLSTPVAISVPTTAAAAAHGYAQTNDRKQEFKWKIINWIDSKALFGDVDTHQQSVVSQAESYLHRFGPGLIVYWFGHAPVLNNLAGEIVICGWELPEKFLLPDGRVIGGK